MNLTQTAGGAAAVHPLDVGMLVFHVTIVLSVLIVLVALFRLPRAFARFWRASEWTQGHFLGYSASRKGGPVVFPGVPDEVYAGGSAKDDQAFQYLARSGPQFDTPPPHIPGTPFFLRSVVSVLHSRVISGFSIGQLIVCACWLDVVLYAAIYRSTGPFTDFGRYGLIATAQLPFVFVFAAKNNIAGVLLGVGYEKLNFLHRHVARIAIVAANIHSFGYVYKWCLAATFQEHIMEPQNASGLLMLIAFNVLLLASSPFVRNRAYNFFFWVHTLFVPACMAAGWAHYPPLRPYLICASAVYGFDKLLRIAKTRISTATIQALPGLNATRVELPYINKGWRAGQHVRVRVLSSSMGIMGWSEIHPFTIASSSRSGNGLVLVCKQAGTWTNKLYRAAAADNHVGEACLSRHVKMIVEGPYGGPGFMMMHSFSAALFVVGGSGITFALGAVQDLIEQDSCGQSRINVIELVWVIHDIESLRPLALQLTSMVRRSRARLSVSVYCTKAAEGDKEGVTPNPAFSIFPGRPEVATIIEGTIARSLAYGAGKSGLIVGVCGPVALADDVVRITKSVGSDKHEAIGGIEIHEETFGW